MTSLLVPVSVRDIELIPKAGSVFEAGFGLTRGTDITGRNDLVIADDDGADGAAKARAPLGHLFGDSQVVLVLGYSFWVHRNFSNFL